MPRVHQSHVREIGKIFFFFFFMHRPGTMTTHAESINLAWTGQTFTIHTTLNTEQNQSAIKVSADN